MHHDAARDPHHAVTLRVGDRIKARQFTPDLRAGGLYEVTDFTDVPFPNQHRSTTRLLDVDRGSTVAAATNMLQGGFRDGAWALA